jgi:hypothetical protein
MAEITIDSVEARKQSKKVRESWLQSISAGELGIDDAITFSRMKERDSTYVANLRLSTILEQLPGWSEAAATSVLLKNGFKSNDTVKTLRSATIKAGKFKRIFELPPPSFASTRPEMPAGWPWQGKLADLVRVTNKNIPSLEFEGLGDEDLATVGQKKPRPSLAVPEQRANPLTGEIVDPQPFWESKPEEIPEQPAEGIDELDLEEFFGSDSAVTVNEDDIKDLFN